MTRGKRIDISLSSFTPVDAAVRCARLAEKSGFGRAWLPEHYGEGRDPMVLLSAMAAATRRIGLGTAVTNPYGRHPFLIANAIATLDELSGGRMVLGIGAGNAGRMQQYLGLGQKEPLKAVREAVAEIRMLLANRTQPGLGYKPDRPGIPIMIAAVQEKMLELAGEIGDGVMFSKATSPDFIKAAARHVKEGRRKAPVGRARFEVAALITCVSDSDEERAAAIAKEQIIDWLVRPRRGELLLSSIGCDLDLLKNLRRISSKRGSREAAKAIPSSVLEHFALYGDAESCIEGIARFRRVGVTLPILSTTLDRQEKLITAMSR